MTFSGVVRKMMPLLLAVMLIIGSFSVLQSETPSFDYRGQKVNTELTYRRRVHNANPSYQKWLRSGDLRFHRKSIRNYVQPEQVLKKIIASEFRRAKNRFLFVFTAADSLRNKIGFQHSIRSLSFLS